MKHAVILACICLVGIMSLTVWAENGAKQCTSEFPLKDCEFDTEGGNKYFILDPGRQLHLSNASCVSENECDGREDVWITVRQETQMIKLKIDDKMRTIETRVVEEFETADAKSKRFHGISLLNAKVAVISTILARK